MRITLLNYLEVLPESLQGKFITMAARARGREILYIAGGLIYNSDF